MTVREVLEGPILTLQALLDATEQRAAAAETALASAQAQISTLQNQLTLLQPPPPPPPPAPLPGLGFYLDDGTIPGVPAVSNTYGQPNQRINQKFEAARLARGTSPNITWTTKGTKRLEGIASGDPTALAWMKQYVDDLVAVAKTAPDRNVYGTLDHESAVKVKRGEITSDTQVIGRALAVFCQEVASRKQANLKSTYWVAGYDRTIEGAIGAAIKANGGRPDYHLTDPYAHKATDTLKSVVSADIAWYKAQPWYDGQPIGLGEFGMMVVNGDDVLAKFYADARGQLASLGLAFGVFFNRQKDNDHAITGRTDGKTFPKAVAAFAASLA
jgi:hypothetical protein